MRRIVLIIAIVAVVGVAGYFLLRPKSSSGTQKASSSETDKPKRKTRSGKVAGRIKPKSKAERRAEKKRRKKEERRRKKEERRRQREKKRRLRAARQKRTRRSKRRGKKGTLYVVSAIVSLGDESYALVDSRRVTVGDVVMGRRIVEIRPDRVIIEAFGKRRTVRVGESIVPYSYTSRKKRR